MPLVARHVIDMYCDHTPAATTPHHCNHTTYTTTFKLSQAVPKCPCRPSLGHTSSARHVVDKHSEPSFLDHHSEPSFLELSGSL